MTIPPRQTLSLEPLLSLNRPLVVGTLHHASGLALFNGLSKGKLPLDLLEARLDSLSPKLLPSTWPLPVIATARHPDEGGKGGLSLSRRRKLLEAALPWASALDIELRSSKELKSVIAATHQHGRTVILSHHDFTSTPALSTLWKLANRASDQGADLFKVATWLQDRADLQRLIEFQMSELPIPVTTMGMGPAGRFSRLVLSGFGAPSLLWMAREGAGARAMAGLGTGRSACGDASIVSSGALLFPLSAGFGYACGAIAVKRSLGAGLSGTVVNFACNAVLALLFQIFWFIPGGAMGTFSLLASSACGILFFLGQIATFKAIATGDVSVATPLLGTKVILVALFSLLLIGRALPTSWWLASLLASIGIALISYSPGGHHDRLALTVGWSLGAASLFAMTDVLVQRWVPLVGFTRFAPVMFGVTGLCSMFYLPALLKEIRHGKEGLGMMRHPVSGMRWLVAGALLLGLQALGMYSAIGLYGSATMTNILYGSRCLWSVVLVWIFGSMAGATLSSNHSRVMGWRFFGALLLFSAMALVLR